MWDFSRKPTQSGTFADFLPVHVLYEFDGPRIFTLKDKDEDLFLAYQCDESSDFQRFIVVPTTEHIQADLLAGRKSVLDAVSQPRVWIVDVGKEWTPSSIWKAEFRSLPSDVLPGPGVMLLPNLQPLFSLRSIGEQIIPGETPGSVIRSVIESAEKCLKTLVDHVLDQAAQQGRRPRSIRRLYDLPAQSFAYNSFEVAFGRPIVISDQQQIGEVQADESAREQEILGNVSDLLQSGLKWVATNPQNADTLDVGPEVKKTILQALLSLAPSTYGYVESVQVGGELIGALRFENPEACTLDRKSRRLVKSSATKLKTPADRIVTPIGFVREADKDRCSFELRGIEDSASVMKFVFDEELGEDVFEAFHEDFRVKIVGMPAAGTNAYQAIAIEKVSDDSGTGEV